jgi:ketosteroid isomerase-like protein
MKKVLLSIALLMFVFIVNAQQNKQDATAKIKALEVSWNAAILEKDHGVKIKNEILADDYIQANPSGKMTNKAETIKMESESKDIVLSVAQGPISVHFYGNNVAIAIGTHSVKGKTAAGKDFTRKYDYADTYMERNGKWQSIGSCLVATEVK